MRNSFITDRQEIGYAIAYVTCLKQEIQKTGSLPQGWRRLGVAEVEDAVAWSPVRDPEGEHQLQDEEGRWGDCAVDQRHEPPPHFRLACAATRVCGAGPPRSSSPLRTFGSPLWVLQEAPPPQLAGRVGLVFLAFSFSINL